MSLDAEWPGVLTPYLVRTRQPQPLPPEVKAHVLKAEELIRRSITRDSPTLYRRDGTGLSPLIASRLELAAGAAHSAGDEQLEAEIIDISRSVRHGGSLGTRVLHILTRAHLE